jgi:hypothetical protein
MQAMESLPLHNCILIRSSAGRLDVALLVDPTEKSATKTSKAVLAFLLLIC